MYILPPNSYKEVFFRDCFLLTAKHQCDIQKRASGFNHKSIITFLHNTDNM